MPTPGVVTHTPADILRAYLLTTGEVVDLPVDPSVPVESLSDWIVYANKMRAERTPDNAVAVVNTAPVKDARAMRGPLILHDGIQVMVRSRDQVLGFLKCKALENYLSEDLYLQTITLDSSTYVLECFSVVVPTTFIGEEEQTERQFHTLNGKFAFRQFA